jgi:hypothetical protein
MDHFHDRGQLARLEPRTGVQTAQTGGKQNQHRAKLLTLKFCDVRCNILNKVAATGKLGGQKFANLPKLHAQQISNLLLQLITGGFGDSHGNAL